MKRKWIHPGEDESASRVYWRGYDELDDTPEFREWLEREFPRGASELSGPEADGESRRAFLKLMGASTALAGFGLASCRRPDQYLVASNEHVEGSIPGKPLHYASALPRPGGGLPVLVTTFDGRPTKVDGNRLHPSTGGGTDVFTQAAVLDLYDPDRSQVVLNEGAPSTLESFKGEFLNPLREQQFAGTAVLVGVGSSPTRDRVLRDLVGKYPSLEVYEYEPLVSEAVRGAEGQLYGEGVSAVPQFDKADRILALDADFLGLDPMGDDAGSQWAKRRKPEGDMARLYVVESAFSLTGGMADHRLRLASSQVPKVAVMLASKLGIGGPVISGLAAKLDLASEIIDQAWIDGVVEDLKGSGAKSLVVAGSRQSALVHALVALINQKLGSLGGADKPLKLVKHGLRRYPGISGLAESITQGRVKHLIVLTPADPSYDAPSDLEMPALLDSLESVAHCGPRLNATARAAAWHVPGAYALETWGDVFSAGGDYSVVQPQILPLNGGFSELDFLCGMAGDLQADDGEGVAYQEVRKTFDRLFPGKGAEGWRTTLRDGFAVLEAGAGGSVRAEVIGELVSGFEFEDFPHADALEVRLVPSSQVWDGRYINNSWLLEVPDPITKLTWDNAAVMSVKTSERLGITRDGQMVRLQAPDGAVIEVPALRMPGQADFTIELALGFGQDRPGRVGENVGFDAYPLSTSGKRYVVTGVQAIRGSGKYPLALTAIHWSMEGRAIVREGTREDYEENPSFAEKQGMDSHIPPNIPLYQGPDYFRPNDEPPNDGAPLQGGFRVDPHHQWGMTIDLNSCLGCNACTIACQAENNIPVVGKDQVIRGREMHWIRMDRYFSSPREKKGIPSQKSITPDTVGRPAHDDDHVEMISQPVACVQCEYAPCETVCPVNATVHTDDGLNAMTYNRCIGTRYCANNCPYKARRFNYFDYNKRRFHDYYLGPLAPAAGLGTTSLKLQKNPNVTVRMRGVIEKCTYCVQRIQSAKIEAKAAARDSKDVQVPANAVRTACQDACPTEAIVFGNLRHPDDAINEAKADPRNYDLLKYVGTRPRTSYLARVRNPNPKMPGAEHVGQATAHMH